MAFACFGGGLPAAAARASLSSLCLQPFFYLQKKLAVGSMNKGVCFSLECIMKGFIGCILPVLVVASGSCKKCPLTLVTSDGVVTSCLLLAAAGCRLAVSTAAKLG